MGGRGKSSGAAKTPTLTGPPMNFADPGAISLEQLEAAERGRFADQSTAAIAADVETLVRDLLVASPSDFADRQEAMARALAQAAHEMKRRPEDERRAFSETLAPLFGQLREQAGES